jgi:pre-mRNA-splicing factor SYF1
MNNFFEDSFKVYQRGVELFIFPQVKAIWVKYIDTFIKRYAGSKLERLRDLFEQSVINAPSNNIAELYIKYAKAEESFGMNRQAMSIYDRATKLVPLIEKLDMYRLYIKKTELLFGITKTRPIYDRAVAELREDMSRSICLDYAGMERKLGEIDRARAILEHGSQYADPRRDKAYWKIWREFEEAHGNVDTFKDMLRVQRSVEAAFSQVNYLAADMLADNTIAQSTLSDMEAIAKRAEQDAIESSQNLGLARNFVPKTAVAAVDTTNNAKSSSSNNNSSSNSNNGNSNQNSSHLHDDEEEEDDSGFVQKPIPSAVFGSMMMDR